MFTPLDSSMSDGIQHRFRDECLFSDLAVSQSVCPCNTCDPQNATHINANKVYKFQRITSYLVHVNFSFQFVAEMVRLLYFLQNVFLMTRWL